MDCLGYRRKWWNGAGYLYLVWGQILLSFIIGLVQPPSHSIIQHVHPLAKCLQHLAIFLMSGTTNLRSWSSWGRKSFWPLIGCVWPLFSLKAEYSAPIFLVLGPSLRQSPRLVHFVHSFGLIQLLPSEENDLSVLSKTNCFVVNVKKVSSRRNHSFMYSSWFCFLICQNKVFFLPRIWITAIIFDTCMLSLSARL